ncbi:cell division protein ZapB [uncultured Treponema sp.]|uniref:cell division protein ZapB n=1 Tax=uncultured Treponema sp. TaxID=162155 RepID=UPI0025FB992A|nr:cell division protein ZapB [uncultured Treponema sp.]
MISIDQVLLLEERVESAVKKIEQLNAENAALRRKCAELSNALNAKSEQFSSFQNDQGKIEEGILKALSRLNAVENIVLSAAGAAQSSLNQNPVNQPAVAAVNNLQISPQHGENSSVSEQTVLSEEQSVQPSVEESIQGDFDANPENPVHEEFVQPQFEAQEPVNTETLASDVAFEFGESEPSNIQNGMISGQNPEMSDGQNSASENPDSSQPMFDIF